MILILGGTSESREVAILCAKKNYPVVYTSTTDIIDELPQSTRRWIGLLSPGLFERLIHDMGVSCVLDATHPFAESVSEMAIELCNKMNVPYLRFERESIKELDNLPYVRLSETINEVTDTVKGIEGFILSTIGVRKLPDLVNGLGERKRQLYVRILPTRESISVCEKLNLPFARILAMQGPFTKDFESALLKELNISVVITKESGLRGGVQAKLEACRKNNCTLVVLKRRSIEYPAVCTTADDCMLWISKLKKKEKKVFKLE